MADLKISHCFERMKVDTSMPYAKEEVGATPASPCGLTVRRALASARLAHLLAKDTPQPRQLLKRCSAISLFMEIQMLFNLIEQDNSQATL